MLSHPDRLETQLFSEARVSREILTAPLPQKSSKFHFFTLLFFAHFSDSLACYVATAVAGGIRCGSDVTAFWYSTCCYSRSPRRAQSLKRATQRFSPFGPVQSTEVAPIT